MHQISMGSDASNSPGASRTGPTRHHAGVEGQGDVRTLYVAGQAGVDAGRPLSEVNVVQIEQGCVTLEGVLRKAASSWEISSNQQSTTSSPKILTIPFRPKPSIKAAKNVSALGLVLDLARIGLLVDDEAVGVKSRQQCLRVQSSHTARAIVSRASLHPSNIGIVS